MIYDNIKEISENKALELGVHMDTVKVCETIRKLAKLNRLSFEDLDRDHRSGLNRHLFGYLEYCGVDPMQYSFDCSKRIERTSIIHHRCQMWKSFPSKRKRYCQSVCRLLQ